jgi:hypothetical protein
MKRVWSSFFILLLALTSFSCSTMKENLKNPQGNPNDPNSNPSSKGSNTYFMGCDYGYTGIEAGQNNYTRRCR